VLLVGLLRWWCCGGGRWRCRGSRTAAPSSDAAVSSGGERDSSSSLLSRFLPYSFVFLVVSPLSSRFVFKFPTPFQAFPSSPFGFISGSLFPFVLSPRFVFYFSPFLPSFFSCSVFVFSPRFPFFVPFFLFSMFPVFSPPPCVGVEPLFIEPKEWGSLLSRMGQGSAGRLASGRRWQGVLPLVSHHQGLGFRDFCKARDSQELMKKEEENCLPSPAACPGEGERRTVSLKTTLFCLFFF